MTNQEAIELTKEYMKRLIDCGENKDDIGELNKIICEALMYAQNLVKYGVDISDKYDSAVRMHYALEKAYIRGRADESKCRWIPCSEELPENAKHKGAFCPKYQVMTRWGQTVGWYNPDRESWYVLLWFMTARFIETEIDIKRGGVPEVVKIPLEMGAVIAWQPLPEPWKGEVNE